MADVLSTAEVTVPVPREAAYASFGGGRWAEWIFDATVDDLRPGLAVRVAFPVAGQSLAGGFRIRAEQGLAGVD